MMDGEDESVEEFERMMRPQVVNWLPPTQASTPGERFTAIATGVLIVVITLAVAAVVVALTWRLVDWIIP